MATLGQQLISPETGWRRYNDTDSRLKYEGTWYTDTGSSMYGGNRHLGGNADSKLKFKFTGTKLRIIGLIYSSRHQNIKISIDGVIEPFSEYSDSITQYQSLVYEKNELPLGVHNVEIYIVDINGKTVELDAIDIDDTGYLIHPIINQISDISNSVEGDCIPCRYTALTSGQAGYFSELGTCIANEIPIAGTPTPDGLFYWIKTDKGTWIADRVIQTNISWDVLNTAKFIEGSLGIDISNITPKMTSDTTIINGITYKTFSDSMYPGLFPFQAFTSSAWLSSDSPFPHNWSIDMGNIISFYGLKFTPVDDVVNIVFKDYKLSYSMDGISYIDILTSTYPNYGPGGQIPVIHILTSPILCRYIKITIISGYNSRSYQWTGIKNLAIFGDLTGTSENVILTSIRSLSGGCAYADVNGDRSLTDKSLGAWPINNEWDKYIVNSDLKGKITKGDNNVWHYNSIQSWTKETPINGTWVESHGGTVTGTNVNRLLRGMTSRSTWNNLNFTTSSNTKSGTTDLGFRPVLNYVESDIASEVIF